MYVSHVHHVHVGHSGHIVHVGHVVHVGHICHHHVGHVWPHGHVHVQGYVVQHVGGRSGVVGVVDVDHVYVSQVVVPPEGVFVAKRSETVDGKGIELVG